MPRSIHRLSAVKANTVKKPGYYADGGNLYLRVAPTGSKGWIFRFALEGRTRDAGLGAFPAVSLVAARAEAVRCRQMVAGGIDPIEARNEERTATRIASEKAMTFDQCAHAFMVSHEAGWKNDKHRAQWRSTLATYARPVLGKLPVDSIDTSLVIKVIEPIWATKPETASRVRGRIEAVLDWAKVRGYRDGENPARWRGHLDHLLPAKEKVRRVKHHAALPYQELGAFMRELQEHTSIAASALRFLILTATRTNETLGARWEEFDLERRMWIVPPERTKNGKEHRVPLSSRAATIVKQMAEIRHSEFVFPAARRKHGLSNMALAMLLRRMRRTEITVHGFRSTFRDWAAEVSAFPREAAELALGHAVSDAVEAAYRRGDMFEKRRKLMDAWATFCVHKHGGRAQ